MSAASVIRCAVIVVAGAVGPSARAGEIVVERATLPIPFLLPASSGGEPGAVDGVIEASGVEPVGDGRYLLVAHDRDEPLVVVETATGWEVGERLTCDRFPNDAKIPTKWEGMARDDRGWFYVIGSHGGKTDEERDAHSFLYRFRPTLGPDGRPVAIDNDSARRWRLASGLKTAMAGDVRDDEALKKRKIEGLTIRTRRDASGRPTRVELVVGLREPGDLVRAYAADITKTPDDDAELALAPLFRFDAGSREGTQSQLTSLEYLPEWQGFLVVTATESADNAFHGNTLWFLPDDRVSSGGAPEVVSIFETAMKAEGIAALPGGVDGRTARLIVTFDNDPHSTHIPSRFQVLTLSRSPR